MSTARSMIMANIGISSRILLPAISINGTYTRIILVMKHEYSSERSRYVTLESRVASCTLYATAKPLYTVCKTAQTANSYTEKNGNKDRF